MDVVTVSGTQRNSLLKDVAAWNRWRQHNPTVTVDLCELDLSQTSLRKANLGQAQLCQTDLSNTNLSYANLYQADLRRANLVKVHGYKTDLSATDLRRATLRRARLSRSNLYEARLCGTDLCGADLSGANLIGAQLIGANLTGADLTGANLAGANLSGANLQGANLSTTNLVEAILLNTNLTGVVWFDANLSGAQLSNNLGLTVVIQSALQSLGAVFLGEFPTRKRGLCHLLLIRDQQGQRLLHLQEGTYRIGRSQKADIQLSDQSVSRHHALLLRMHDSDRKGFYRLVDGDGKGNLSRNGVKVNQAACSHHNLESGDLIKVGRSKIQYRIQEFTDLELQQYLEEMNRPGIPSSVDLFKKGTMHSYDL